MQRAIIPVNRRALFALVFIAGSAASVLSWIGLGTLLLRYDPAAVTKISDLEVANKIQMINSSGPTFTAGAGDPNGAITAPIGSIRMRTDSAVLYQNTDGAMAWVPFGALATSLTPGSVLFAGTTGLISQDNTAFFWNNTDKTLTVTSPNATAIGASSNSTTSGTMFITNTNVSGPSDFYATNNAGSARISFGYGNATYADTARAGRGYVWRNTGVDFVFARSNVVDGMLFSDGNFNLGTTTTNPAVKLRVEGTLVNTSSAFIDNSAASSFGLNVGHDTTLTTNANRGWHATPFSDGNIYIDTKTHSGGTTFFRAGAGAEAGSARTVMSWLNASGNIGINGTAATAQRVLIAASTGQNALTAQNAITGQTANTITVNAQQTGSYNTSGGVLQSYGVAANVSSTRSAGGNNLQNIAVYANAASAQVNTAVHTDNGNVLLNQISGNTSVGTSTTSEAKFYVQTTSGTMIDGNNNGTGQTATARGVRGRSTGTLNTTGSVLTSYGVYGESTSTRSAGGNDLTNVGVYATASGAQINTALLADAGNVRLNVTSGTTALGIGQQIISGGAPSVNNGTLGTGSTNWAGNVTGIGANSSVVLTFSAAFANRSWCFVQGNANSANPLTSYVVTNSASAPTIFCFDTQTAVAADCDDFSYTCIGQ